MAVLRSVAKTDTFEKQRQTINLIGQDLLNLSVATGEGSFSLADGAVSSPGLFFTNVPNTGLYRGTGKSINIGSNGIGVSSFSETYLTSFQDFRTLVTAVPLGQNSVTLSDGGSNYNGGTYSNVPFTGGSGSGLFGTVIVEAFTGTISNGGSGYTEGTYNNVSLSTTGGTATANITVETIGGNITNNGTGGSSPGTFNNVPLTGGNGSGATATLIVLSNQDGDGNVNIQVSQVDNLNLNNSTYQVGDVLTANSAQINNVSGFQFTLTEVGRITNVDSVSIDPGLSAGAAFTVNPSDVGGTGQDFSFTLDVIGPVTSVDITSGGNGYITGEVLGVRSYELYPTVTKFLKLKQAQLIEFSGTLPTTGFNPGDTVTHDGSTSIVTRKYESGGTINAIIVDQENFGELIFNPGNPSISDGTNTATYASTQNALNYYFADDPAPLPDDEYTAWVHLPDLTLEENKRYRFIQLSDVAAGVQTNNEPHPLKFSETPDGIHTDGGVIYVGAEVDYNYSYPDAIHAVEIIVDANTPTTLYYYCGAGENDPLVEHINEGGFDGREASLTKSGSIQAYLGTDFALTLGTVDETQSVTITTDGAATFASTISGAAGSFSDALQAQYGLAVTGAPLTVSDKFSVAHDTGNTVIEGTLTVNDELSFTDDASFGGTLYIDSVNNKVSVNRDPSVTALVESFEVVGSILGTGNSIFAQDSGTSLSVGGTGTSAKLDVTGSAIVSGVYNAPPTGNVQVPVYTFNGLIRSGLSANTSNSSFSATGLSGELIRFGSTEISSFRDVKSYSRTFDSITITNPGEGYTAGSYNGVASSGGTGAGLTADVVVSFSLPLGKIATVGSINQTTDATRIAGTYNNVSSYTTSGTGTGAKFIIVVDALGDVTSVSLDQGQITTFTNTTNTIGSETFAAYTEVSGSSSASGSGATFTISRDGSGGISSVTLVSDGNNYAVGETITILGSNVGGSDGSDDITITVQTVTIGGGFGYGIGEIITIPGSLFSDGVSTPSGFTFNVLSLTSNPGAGYTDGDYVNVPLSTTNGGGSGATADLTITGGEVSSIVVIGEGDGLYETGDILSFDHNNLIDLINGTTSAAPSTQAQLTVGSFGAIQRIVAVNSGLGYETGDVITFPQLPGSPSTVGSATIGTVTQTSTIELITDTGLVSANTVKALSGGINVNDILTISGNNINSSVNGDVVVNPGASSKLLSIGGTGGIKVPVGTKTNRPSASTLGIIRYNTETSQYEGSNGSDFISLGGVRDVDGNTFILAEATVGANDNILYFYNDDTNSARFEKNKIELVTSNVIESVNTDGKLPWAESTAFTLNQLVYTTENIYEVTVGGTTGTVAPSHTIGAVIDDGGVVEFTYVSSLYQPLTFKASNITFDSTLSFGTLDVYTYNTNVSVLESSAPEIEFAFDKISGVPNTLLALDDSGRLKLNKSFDTANAQDEITFIDYTAKFIELDDVTIKTNDLSLTKGVTDSGVVVLYDPSSAKSTKVTITAENVTTGVIHTTEFSVITNGTDIFVNEYGSLNTGTEQFTTLWSFSPSNEVQVQITLDTSLTSSNNVVITTSSTTIKK